MDIQPFAQRLARIRGVVAVALGGSRATKTHRPVSDWDFGLYYRGHINTDYVRGLGYAGQVVEPGDWGRIVNGGAWLLVEGERVDLLYRDLDFVQRCVDEAAAGRYEVDNVVGHIAGLPTYTLVGELSLCRVLHGDLLRPTFPPRLRETAPPWWLGSAAFSLMFAEGYAELGQVTGCAGSLARAAFSVAHARLAERGEWALNEKDLLARAGLPEADGILGSVGLDRTTLQQSASLMRKVLGLRRPPGLKFDQVVSERGPGGPS